MMRKLIIASFLLLWSSQYACSEKRPADQGAIEEALAPFAHLTRPLTPPPKRTGRDIDPLALIDEARDVLRESGDHAATASVLQGMMGLLNDHGLKGRIGSILDEAYDAATRIEDPEKRNAMIGAIFLQDVRAGETARALEFLEKPWTGPEFIKQRTEGAVIWTKQPEALVRELLIQEMLARLVSDGQAKRAEKVLVEQDFPESRRIMMLARAKAQAGDGIGALALWKKTGRDRREDMKSLPAIQAGSGDFTGALETARAIKDETIRYKAIMYALYEQIKKDDPVGAIEAVRREIHPFPRSKPDKTITQTSPPAVWAWVPVARTYEEAAVRLAERGYVAEAAGLLERDGALLTEQSRALVLAAIAQGYIVQQEWEKAQAAIDAALVEADKISESFLRQPPYMQIGRAMAAAGDLEGAWKRLHATLVPPKKNADELIDSQRGFLTAAYAWGRIIAAGENADEATLDRLLKPFVTEESPSYNPSTRGEIINYLIRGGDIARSVQVARSEKDTLQRAALLLKVSRKMLETWGATSVN